MDRHFTVAVFVVHEKKVLLLRHRKLNMWLPPGGHIEKNELPDDAAVREVKEETGLDICLVGDKGLNIGYPMQLTIPKGIQLEDIGENHQHIDLVYFAKVLGDDTLIKNSESDEIGWYNYGDLPQDVNDEIRLWCKRAINEI